ncbi:MAG: transmembrane(s)protein [candidate division WS6 bacterium 36_33]|uniref:Transmembrane(S)protein n=1 Tax=candidate division WS6 bacterium 36_33 TaxID=1641388 RepID=A0A101GZ92_9BACT|nr:MAG: transmembrane(s)protein [candidate division WS6 bacterium 36_33]
MLIPNIFLTILGLFALVYLESMFLALIGIKLSLIIFFFLFRKVDLKIFFIISFIVLLIFDVVYKLPLGSNILIFSVPLLLYLLISMFVSLESSLVAFLIKTVIFWVYYIVLLTLPNLFVVGRFGALTWNEVLRALLSAFLTTLGVFMLDYILAGFRKRGNSSQIRLK